MPKREFFYRARTQSASSVKDGALFTRCTRDFAELSRALRASSCPLCSVLSARTAEFVRNAADSSHQESQLLCSRHLALALEQLQDSRAKAKLVRRSVIFGASEGSRGKPACPICASVQHTSEILQRAIHGLDRRIRFQKAIEAGPLFCHHHREQVCYRNSAPHFARIQQEKLRRLADDLARAEHSGGSEAERLVAQTLGYLQLEVAPGGNGLPPIDKETP
jgi:hypothetical protein